MSKIELFTSTIIHIMNFIDKIKAYLKHDKAENDVNNIIESKTELSEEEKEIEYCKRIKAMSPGVEGNEQSKSRAKNLNELSKKIVREHNYKK